MDYLLEHNGELPLTLALFYDSRDMDEQVMRYLAIRLLDIYIVKKADILENNGNLQKDKESTEEYEAAFPIILENVSKQYEIQA